MKTRLIPSKYDVTCMRMKYRMCTVNRTYVCTIICICLDLVVSVRLVEAYAVVQPVFASDMLSSTSVCDNL